MNFTIKYWSNHNAVSGLGRALSLFILLSLFSCDNETNSFGGSVLPEEDSVNIMVKNNFTITGYTITPSSYYSRDVDTFLVGGIKSEVFGEVTAKSIFQFSPRISFYTQEDSIVDFGQPYLLLYPAGNVGIEENGVHPNIHAYEITGGFDTLTFSYSNADLALLEKTLLNEGFYTDSNSLIKINLPQAYADKYLKPYVNHDSLIVEYDNNGEVFDTLSYWGVKFNTDAYKRSLNPILIETAADYKDYITKIVALNSSIIFPIEYSDGALTSLRFYLSEIGNHNFNANYFSYNNASSEYMASVSDTAKIHDNLFLQTQRSQAKLVIDGLDDLKNNTTSNVFVYKASLTLPVSNIEVNSPKVLPGRISLKFYDNSILPDDPQSVSPLVNTLYLSRFDGAYYDNIDAYKFDISLYVEAYLNGVIDKNEFILYIPDHIITSYDNSSVLDTIIDSKNKAEMVVLKNRNDAESPMKLDVFYTTVDK